MLRILPLAVVLFCGLVSPTWADGSEEDNPISRTAELAYGTSPVGRLALCVSLLSRSAAATDDSLKFKTYKATVEQLLFMQADVAELEQLPLSVVQEVVAYRELPPGVADPRVSDPPRDEEAMVGWCLAAATDRERLSDPLP